MNRGQLNTILNLFTETNVQLRRERKKEALNCWQPIVKEIVEYVKVKEISSGHRRFNALTILPTGSYYERAKVGEPDEFDLMLVVDNLALDGEPFEEDDGFHGDPLGFTTVMIDMGEQRLWQQEGCVNRRGMLNATQVKAVFARLVREAIMEKGYASTGGGEECRESAAGRRGEHSGRGGEDSGSDRGGRGGSSDKDGGADEGEDGDVSVEVKSEGPAVTLKITNSNGRKYSVDLTLAIKDYSWPEDAEEWKTRHRNGWPNQQLIQDIYQDGCHLVAKKPKGHHLVEEERGFLWRYSFSAAEKKLFLRGGHGEASSCRKQVLRILKALKEGLHLEPLKSYHLKTLLLYECESKPHFNQWSCAVLGERFLDLLQRLETCLRSKNCPHYFITDLNLFEMLNSQKCNELAERVKKIRQQPQQVLNKLIQQPQMA